MILYTFKLIFEYINYIIMTNLFNNVDLQQIEELTFHFSSAKEPLRLGVEASKHLAESIFMMTHLRSFGLHRVETEDDFFSVISKPHPSSKVKNNPLPRLAFPFACSSDFISCYFPTFFRKRTGGNCLVMYQNKYAV